MTQPHETRPPGVLLVDDEPQVRAVLAFGLALHGFVVWEAAGGAEAVELLRQHPYEIDVALLDLNMPGMDGLATATALRRVKLGLPWCLMSGSPEQGEDALEVDHVLQKPFSLSELAGCVRRLVKGAPAAESSTGPASPH